MKKFHSLLLVTVTLLISACSPHPVSGVWGTAQDNEYGISKLTMGFDGRAQFVTTKLNNAIWHCFWSATGKKQANLDCNPSTDKEQKDIFMLNINDQGDAELMHKSKLISTFKLLNENPAIKE